ncbi:hypothetical protein J7J84_06185 [bacterium]|nr:hypothetical protein [bacterium]
MGKTKYDRGGQALLWALSFALVVMVGMMLAASCGNSENGPPAVLWSPELPG